MPQGQARAVQVRRLSERFSPRTIDVFTLGEIWTAEGDDARRVRFDHGQCRMKLLVVGGSSELDGALRTIVTRLAERSDLEIDQPRSARLIFAHHGPGTLLQAGGRWLREGEKRGYTAVVLVIDEDGHPERVTQFAAAQNYMNATIKRALESPSVHSMRDAADEKALSAVFTQVIDRQKDLNQFAIKGRVQTVARAAE